MAKCASQAAQAPTDPSSRELPGVCAFDEDTKEALDTAEDALDTCRPTSGRQSNCCSEDHQLQKASTPSISTPLVTRKIGLKSRPLASSSTPVKYCALAPATTAMTEEAP